MSTKTNTSHVKIGRQSQLPFKRALAISVNSLKIRFGRSLITTAGIMLGIAFLSTVLTQSKLQWPIQAPVKPGYVRIDGQINAPGDIPAWYPVPVSKALEAGIPKEVVALATNDDGTVSMTKVENGIFQAQDADKELVRVKGEVIAFQKVMQSIYLTDWDITVNDAVAANVPENIARALAGKGTTFKATALKQVVDIRDTADALYQASPKDDISVDLATKTGVPAAVSALFAVDGKIKPRIFKQIIELRENVETTFYTPADPNRDLTVQDAEKGNVPLSVAEYLAGNNKTFKSSALATYIANRPAVIKDYESKIKKYAIYKTVKTSSVDKIAQHYMITLDEAITRAKGYIPKSSDKARVMVVNEDRRIEADRTANKGHSGNIRLHRGDNILVPDLNTHYRGIWLAIMALLVCMVGIMNSMLMAVTERFKEIGTMKCLGALDKFVVTLFLLESGMMGVVASVIGSTLGFIIMVVLAGFSKGWQVVGTLDFLSIVYIFSCSIGAGLLITLVATIIPAMRAAEMPAAMALRSEI